MKTEIFEKFKNEARKATKVKPFYTNQDDLKFFGCKIFSGALIKKGARREKGGYFSFDYEIYTGYLAIIEDRVFQVYEYLNEENKKYELSLYLIMNMGQAKLENYKYYLTVNENYFVSNKNNKYFYFNSWSRYGIVKNIKKECYDIAIYYVCAIINPINIFPIEIAICERNTIQHGSIILGFEITKSMYHILVKEKGGWLF